jgi:hypothetical protein
MSKLTQLEEAESLTANSPSKAEAIYKQILNTPLGMVARRIPRTDSLPTLIASKTTDDQEKEKQLRDQETALVQLGKLYRDQK